MHLIESLEPRIAPASVFVTYTDIDGDLVKITASIPGATAPPLDAADLSYVGLGTAAKGQLAQLNVSDAGFDGAKIVFSVAKKGSGDGLAHVGYINGLSRDLDQVIVKGDLGKIVVGNGNTANDPGLNLLSVRSMGIFGSATGAPDQKSTVFGKLGALNVAGDFTDVSLTVLSIEAGDSQIGSISIGGDLTGGKAGTSGSISAGSKIGSVRIGGSIIAGDGGGSGRIASETAIESVFVGGDVVGGALLRSGTIAAPKLGSVTIGGDLVGGAGDYSGSIFAKQSIQSVKIGGDMRGGVGTNSGKIEAEGSLGPVTIAGDLLGGSGSNSGLVLCLATDGKIGAVKIGGDLVGGSITGAADSINTGGIRSNGSIASVTIGGSIIAGYDGSTGTLTRSGAIIAGDDLGPVKVKGSLVGNDTNPVQIIARGEPQKPATGSDLAIASIIVGGDVRHAKILAGFAFDGTPANADGSIGIVSVGQNWVASSVVAGAQDAGGAGFGNGDTLQTVNNNTALIARIAKIAIKGDISGSALPGDHFGFVAQQIDKFTYSGGRVLPLVAGPGSVQDNYLASFTNDVRLLEVK